MKITKAISIDKDTADAFWRMSGNKSKLLEEFMESYILGYDVTQEEKDLEKRLKDISKEQTIVQRKLKNIRETKENSDYVSATEFLFITKEIPRRLKDGVKWGPIRNDFNNKFNKNFTIKKLREAYSKK